VLAAFALPRLEVGKLEGHSQGEQKTQQEEESHDGYEGTDTRRSTRHESISPKVPNSMLVVSAA